MERSLVLIKPDAMERGLAGAILGRIQAMGLKLVALKMLRMDESLAKRHYAPHAAKPFFPGLVAYICSAPIVAAVFEGEDVVNRIRRCMGATDPAKAEPGTLRADFGQNIELNAIHGSDSPETARNEISLFFSGAEIFVAD